MLEDPDQFNKKEGIMLANRNIVVTGAASGIGAESAKEIKKQGATVIGVDLNQPQENIDLFVRADLTDPVSIESAIADIPDGIDAVCNIAGLPPTKDRVMVLKRRRQRRSPILKMTTPTCNTTVPFLSCTKAPG